ncbi:MAG: DNA primase family protein [Gammaproteobacteria bacterium]
MWIAWGIGANGKSTMLNTFMKLLGPYSCVAAPELLMAKRGDRHPTELADLHGARLVTAIESGEGRRLNESLIKQVTGGDPVKARRMREDFWPFTPQFKLWLATNHRPDSRGTDHAIWRRLSLIPFTVVFHDPDSGETPVKDVAMAAKLRAELPGILNWSLEGCRAWQQDGLRPPAVVKQAVAAYRQDMDVIASFVDECCVVGPGKSATAADLYRSYVQWSEAAGEKPETKTSFGLRLRERGFEPGAVKNTRVWRGIGCDDSP